jgi:uncharacterized protein with ATP-grasp and redox domains
MRFDERCFDCLLSRVRLECSLCGAEKARTEEIVGACASLLEEIRDRPLTHPEIASRMHRCAYEMLGNQDPFAGLKAESTRQALEVCRALRPRLHTFRDIVLASIIGNTFDYGVKSHRVTDNFSRFFSQEFAGGLAIDDTDRILEKIEKVVYFTDNCGEIVFDRLLLEDLHRRGSRITLVVRDAPILNDATMKEADELHLSRFVDRVTTTGCGCELGVRMDLRPPELVRAMDECTLVISKGMANYESFSEYSDLPPIAYLMSVKCDPIADEVGVPRGSKVAILRED